MKQRTVVFWLGLLGLGCRPDSNPKEEGGTVDSGEAGTTVPDTDTPEDSAEPCECDDGLVCNGTETCDDNGVCIPGIPLVGVDDGDPCTLIGECNEATGTFDLLPNPDDPRCVEGAVFPVVDGRDYGVWYWPSNHRPTETWPTVERIQHFSTGHYALALREDTATIEHLGVWPDALSAPDLYQRSPTDVTVFPSASVRIEAGPSAGGVTATGFQGATPTAIDRTRMVDGGMFMNRVEVPEVRYAAEPSLEGRFQVASMPRHFVLTHTVEGASPSANTARVGLGGDFLAGLDNENWLLPGRALELTDDVGQGWVFVIYDTAGGITALTYSADEGVLAERVRVDPSQAENAVSMLVLPRSSVSEDEIEMYLDPTRVVSVAVELLDVEGATVGASSPAVWDATLGAFRVDPGTLQDSGAPRSADFDDPAFHHWHGRHRLSVQMSGIRAAAVPLAIFGSDKLSWYITGGVGLFRSEDGQPIGIPVQISKNWHGSYWYHFYSQPTFTEDTTMEFTVASSSWGPGFAASHAQLSLIGWGEAGGRWDESALGAFGESVTYDPDLTLGRAMMDDVRPLQVLASRRWSWTGNVGGADFLRYKTDTESYWERRLAGVRTLVRSVGPVLTDVVYGGTSTDGRIAAQVRVQMGSSDDLVRVFYHLDYTFLEDVSYSRLAFFQVAADNYGDNGFAQIAWGDETGVSETRVVTDHGTTGYASDADRGILLPGSAPWVLLYDNQRDGDTLPEHLADVGFVVRSFEADIGGTLWTTPAININRTRNGQSQLAFELSLPDEEGAAWCGAPCGGQRRFVPAGSRVQATIEYLVPPADKTAWYGESAHLLALSESTFGSTDMMVHLAANNDLEVTATTGSVARRMPTEIQAEDGPIAAEFVIRGGLGIVPVTIHGLVRADGWRLQRWTDGDWETVDLSVHGNDWWQTTWESTSASYSLTYPVPAAEEQTLRVVWDPTAVSPLPVD